MIFNAHYDVYVMIVQTQSVIFVLHLSFSTVRAPAVGRERDFCAALDRRRECAG